jgi:hypothetical protein
MRTSERGKLFNAFYRAARENDVFDERTSLMLHLASAMAVGCYP